jgi:hypothetical protein
LSHSSHQGFVSRSVCLVCRSSRDNQNAPAFQTALHDGKFHEFDFGADIFLGESPFIFPSHCLAIFVEFATTTTTPFKMFQFPPFGSYCGADWASGEGQDVKGKSIKLTRFCNGQETHLVLVHIPVELYSFCLQPILRLLFGEDHDEDASKIPWTNRHDFLNVSITPVECSIICSRWLADRFIRPVAESLNALHANSRTPGKTKGGIQISEDDYIVIQVDGQGLDAGQRVLELTSPLAMAGMLVSGGDSRKWL